MESLGADRTPSGRERAPGLFQDENFLAPDLNASTRSRREPAADPAKETLEVVPFSRRPAGWKPVRRRGRQPGQRRHTIGLLRPGRTPFPQLPLKRVFHRTNLHPSATTTTTLNPTGEGLTREAYPIFGHRRNVFAIFSKKNVRRSKSPRNRPKPLPGGPAGESAFAGTPMPHAIRGSAAGLSLRANRDCERGWGCAVCAAPWLRSGEYARG